MTNRLSARRLLPSSALVPLLLAACQRPHVCSASCEAGLIPGAGAAAVAPAAQQPVAAQEQTPPPQVADAPAPAEITPGEALAAFDEAWQSIHDTHFDTKFNGVDWDALKTELRPRAESARTRDEVRAVIGEMVARLGQSHFALIPSGSLPDADSPHDQAGGFGFDVRLRDGLLLVVSLEPAGPAAAAGVKLGWSVRSIGDLDVPGMLGRMGAASAELGARKIAFQMWAVAQAHMLGPVGERETLTFADGEDHPHELELARAKRDVTAHDVGPTLPTFYLKFQSEVLERGAKKVGLIAFSNWFLPVMQPIDAAVERMRACDGMILDLRGNTGGAVAMNMGIAGHFFAEPKKLGAMLTRDSTMNIMAIPRRVNAAGELVEPFAGPLAVLVDEATASASESFAGGLQSVGRARIFGETTAGAVLPATTTRLSSGDSLLHAMGDFETSTGARLEGVGVVPDQVVPLTRAELLAGRDPVLESALDWILAQSP